jgi:predicted SAM-dependent methyltransferase
MRMILGGHIDQYDYHKVGLTFDILSELLMEAGFQKIEKVDDLQLFIDTSGMKYKDIPISLNIVAVKEAAE